MSWDAFEALTDRFPLPNLGSRIHGRHVQHDAGYLREEPGAGKPHARICEGEAEWPSYSTTIQEYGASSLSQLYLARAGGKRTGTFVED